MIWHKIHASPETWNFWKPHRSRATSGDCNWPRRRNLRGGEWRNHHPIQEFFYSERKIVEGLFPPMESLWSFCWAFDWFVEAGPILLSRVYVATSPKRTWNATGKRDDKNIMLNLLLKLKSTVTDLSRNIIETRDRKCWTKKTCREWHKGALTCHTDRRQASWDLFESGY